MSFEDLGLSKFYVKKLRRPKLQRVQVDLDLLGMEGQPHLQVLMVLAGQPMVNEEFLIDLLALLVSIISIIAFRPQPFERLVEIIHVAMEGFNCLILGELQCFDYLRAKSWIEGGRWVVITFDDGFMASDDGLDDAALHEA